MSDQAHPFMRWFVAATASTISESLTFPLDVIKVRLQLQQKNINTCQSKGALEMVHHIFRSEGLRGFYNGIYPAIVRQAINGGIGVGFYRPVRALFLTSPSDPPADLALWKRILAGSMTGCAAQLVSSPLDVIKIRIQADEHLAAQGLARRYVLKDQKMGWMDTFAQIYKQEGIQHGLYRGASASMQRAAVIHGSSIATYDHMKHCILRHHHSEETLQTHVIASGVSGFVAAVVSNPLDVIKTRMMHHKHRCLMWPCFRSIVQHEGFTALYKGFLPAYSRLAPWQLCFFVSYERISKSVFDETL